MGTFYYAVTETDLLGFLTKQDRDAYAKHNYGVEPKDSKEIHALLGRDFTKQMPRMYWNGKLLLNVYRWALQPTLGLSK